MENKEEIKKLMEQKLGFKHEELEKAVKKIMDESVLPCVDQIITILDGENPMIREHALEISLSNLITGITTEENASMFMAKLQLQVILAHRSKGKKEGLIGKIKSYIG